MSITFLHIVFRHDFRVVVLSVWLREHSYEPWCLLDIWRRSLGWIPERFEWHIEICGWKILPREVL